MQAILAPQFPQARGGVHVFRESANVSRMIHTIFDARRLLYKQMVMRWRKWVSDLSLDERDPKHGLHFSNRRDGAYEGIRQQRDKIPNQFIPTPGRTKPMNATDSSPDFTTFRTSA
jgi:hypothetical protein